MPNQRAVQILSMNLRGSIIAVRKASSLKAALEGHYEETLKPVGYKKPLYKGNTLSVVGKNGQKRMYRAVDA
jgi:hypothetical protein